jgi:hypothetical protein
VAVRRQRLRPEDKPIRAAVKATVRSVKHVFPGDKLLARATMMICASAMMANLRRIHRWRRENGIAGFIDLLEWMLRRLYKPNRRLAPSNRIILGAALRNAPVM